MQFMGGGAKQRMIKYRLCRRYDWTKRFHAWEVSPPMYGKVADNKIVMGGWTPLPLAPDKLCPCSHASFVKG